MGQILELGGEAKVKVQVKWKRNLVKYTSQKGVAFIIHYSAEIGSIPFLRNAKVININTVPSQGCNKIADAAIDKQFSNQA